MNKPWSKPHEQNLQVLCHVNPRDRLSAPRLPNTS
jgi:hypothetical protein